MKSLNESDKTINNAPEGEQRVPELPYEVVSELAYFKAEKRHFEPGHELEDWLEAEKECLMHKNVTP